MLLWQQIVILQQYILHFVLLKLRTWSIFIHNLNRNKQWMKQPQIILHTT